LTQYCCLSYSTAVAALLFQPFACILVTVNSLSIACAGSVDGIQCSIIRDAHAKLRHAKLYILQKNFGVGVSVFQPVPHPRSPWRTSHTACNILACWLMHVSCLIMSTTGLHLQVFRGHLGRPPAQRRAQCECASLKHSSSDLNPGCVAISV
jgi:hypothetical protein